MRILICPLNWGLGHATRCVPIIRKFVSEGHEVLLAADGFPLEFLKSEFPGLKMLELPSYAVQYSEGNTQVGAMIRSLPNILRGIYREHNWLRGLLKTEHFDLVISDNRFGLWTKRTECIYMTHQLMIKMPEGLKMFEPLAWWLHRQIINRFSTCWIPDYEEKNGFSGDLAHKYRLPLNAKFVGPLTRFLPPETYKPDTSHDVVALVSGVEPQRTLFENQMVQRFANSKEKVLILTGKPATKNNRLQIGNISFATHIADAELASYLLGAKKIISRSGYSTIMDLHQLKCLQKAEFIPTPGQTEQEYLAEYINKFQVAYSI